MPRPVRFVLSSLWIACTLAFAAPVWAVDFNDFACITNDDAGDCAIGESQLSASIVAAGEDAILTLTMSGPDDAVVEQLFIESTIVSDIRFEGSVGVGVVAFGSGEHGGNLPGGNPIGFLEAFNISAKKPAPLNGIGRHEQDDTSAQSADFLLSLEGGDFDDLIADLRIGVHVIGYDSNGSESFVSTPVPEPSTLVLVGLGLALATRQRARSLTQDSSRRPDADASPLAALRFVAVGRATASSRALLAGRAGYLGNEYDQRSYSLPAAARLDASASHGSLGSGS